MPNVQSCNLPSASSPLIYRLWFLTERKSVSFFEAWQLIVVTTTYNRCKYKEQFGFIILMCRTFKGGLFHLNFHLSLICLFKGCHSDVFVSTVAPLQGSCFKYRMASFLCGVSMGFLPGFFPGVRVFLSQLKKYVCLVDFWVPHAWLFVSFMTVPVPIISGGWSQNTHKVIFWILICWQTSPSHCFLLFCLFVFVFKKPLWDFDMTHYLVLMLECSSLPSHQKLKIQSYMDTHSYVSSLKTLLRSCYPKSYHFLARFMPKTLFLSKQNKCILLSIDKRMYLQYSSWFFMKQVRALLFFFLFFFTFLLLDSILWYYVVSFTLSLLSQTLRFPLINPMPSLKYWVEWSSFRKCFFFLSSSTEGCKTENPLLNPRLKESTELSIFTGWFKKTFQDR